MFCFSSTGETTWSFLLCWQLTAAAAAAVVIVVVVVVVSQPLVRLPGEGGDSIHCTSGSKWIL